MTGFSWSRTVLISLSTWQIRSAEAREMMTITKIIEIIIMLMRICSA